MRRLRSPVTRVAEPDRATRPVRLPAWCLRLRLPGPPGRWRYFFAGDPDFGRPAQPWRYVERMGDAWRLESGDDRLTIVTRKRGPFVTEARLIVEPRPDLTSGA